MRRKNQNAPLEKLKTFIDWCRLSELDSVNVFHETFKRN